MDPLEKLLAVEEIKFLKARYFRFLDTKQWKQWEQLFVPALVTEFPGDRPGRSPFNGRAEFVRAIEGSLGPALTLHHGHTPEIEIQSPTSARGTWVMQDWLHWKPDTPLPEIGVRNVIGWGHYHETYAKSAEGWRIASLKLTRVHVDRY